MKKESFTKRKNYKGYTYFQNYQASINKYYYKLDLVSVRGTSFEFFNTLSDLKKYINCDICFSEKVG
jgi:hypothetical protein